MQPLPLKRSGKRLKKLDGCLVLLNAYLHSALELRLQLPVSFVKSWRRRPKRFEKRSRSASCNLSFSTRATSSPKATLRYGSGIQSTTKRLEEAILNRCDCIISSKPQIYFHRREPSCRRLHLPHLR